MNYLGIVAIVLLIIIVYFFIRLRQMMKNARGARNDMNTMELIKNWQEQKAADAQRDQELRDRAKEYAQADIEATMIERYRQEEIARATTPQSERLKTTLKQGLGIDADKVFGRDNIDRIVGNRQIKGIDPGVDSKQIFDRDRIDRMAGHNSMDPNRIKQAAGSINYEQGVKRGVDSGTQFTGLNRALGRDVPPPRRPPPRRI